MAVERRKIQRAVDDKRGHSGRTVGLRDADAVNTGFDDSRECHDRSRDLRCGDVLALPAKRVADPIEEIIKSARVAAHQVAGAVPGIAALEHVAQDFSLRLLGAGVALELAAGGRRLAANPADRLAAFAGRAAYAETIAVARGLLGDGIEFHQRQGEAVSQERRDPADGARFALDVEERDVALGRRVELEDPGDLEPGLEFLPNIGAKSV